MKHNWERDENGNINKWAWAAGFHNGVFCVDCGKSVCVHCKPDYMELDDCTGPQKPKVMTNADRIRAMSDEELAEWLACPICKHASCKKTCPVILLDADPCEMQILGWLQQPAEDDA